MTQNVKKTLHILLFFVCLFVCFQRITRYRTDVTFIILLLLFGIARSRESIDEWNRMYLLEDHSQLLCTILNW